MQNIVRSSILSSAFVMTFAGIDASVAADPKWPDANTASVADARREAQILTSYGINPHLNAFGLSVSVRGDQATLGGVVEDKVASDLAEQIAMDVSDISHVENRIRVDANYAQPQHSISDRSFGDKVKDATTTASVRSKLSWNSNTDALDIHVDTRDGKVTLTGSADSNAERSSAARVARDTDGVVSLDNEIALADKSIVLGHVVPVDTQSGRSASDSWITSKVKSTLVLTRNMNSFDVAVTTVDGVVSLNGEVDTAAQREHVMRVAQEVRGVKKVEAGGLFGG
jgi:hyperosmotically inducible periplasmic protein